MIKSITNFLIIFFIFQQLKSQISQIDKNGYNAFCDETLQMKSEFMQKPIYTNFKVFKVSPSSNIAKLNRFNDTSLVTKQGIFSKS